MAEAEVDTENARIELPPVPGNKTFVSQIAAIIAVVVPMVAHQAGFTNFPALDQSAIIPWLTVVFGVGLMLHRQGLNTVGQYILIHLAPIVQQVVEEALARAQTSAMESAQPVSFVANDIPGEDLTRFVPILEAMGVHATQTPSPMAFTINGKPYEPADLLRAVESLRAGK